MAFAVDTQGKPTTADGNIQAMYGSAATERRRPASTSSASGCRISLPGLEKFKLQVTTEKGEIAQELSPANGDVTL